MEPRTRSRNRLEGAALAALAAAALVPQSAGALVGDRFGDFGLDGSLRTITAATYNYDFPPLFGEDNPGDGFSQTLLRLTAGGEPADWLIYEVHGVQSLSFSTLGESAVQGPGLFATGGMTRRYRALDLSWEWASEPDIQAGMVLDRCSLKFILPWFDLTLGRQAVTFGKAYFWNPLDVYLAFDPTQFDRDYKAGVDAVRVDIPLGAFSGINLVGVAGRRLTREGAYRDGGFAGASWYGSSVLARVYTNQWDWDFALQGGKVYGGYQAGAAASGEVDAVAVRAEAAWFFSQDADDLLDHHLAAVVGVGHRFESSLDIEAEYIYNGAGESDPALYLGALQRVMSGDSYHLGRHLVGLVATYEILPILTGSAAWIFSFTDNSSLLQPGLTLSVADEADFLFGAMIALGRRPGTDTLMGEEVPVLQSEFGTYPNFYYMEFKFYF